MKIVALIPARSGSKGIPAKNIRPICGKPLLYWACKAAADCDFIDSVHVSTDDPDITATVRNFALPKVSPIARTPETDSASTKSVMLDFAQRVPFDALVLIQATSPLLSANDLEHGWNLYQSGNCDSVLSVVPQKRFIWEAKDNNQAVPINYDPAKRPLRQSFDGFLVENGAFYITSREALEKTECRLSGRIGYQEMPADTYLELDQPEDWSIVETILAKRLRQEAGHLKDRLAKIRFVATDVDGCLTDSGMYYSESGDEQKKFNTRDGVAFILLMKEGILTGIITQENTAMVERRAKTIGVEEVHQGAQDKVAVMESILSRRGLRWEEVAYLGDDIGDREVLKRVGVGACPADAATLIREIAEIRLRAIGGGGALRELVERILIARDGRLVLSLQNAFPLIICIVTTP